MNLNKIEDVIRPVIESIGVRLYDVEFLGRTLRVTISKPQTEVASGVTLEECAQVSRLISPLLDNEDVIPGGRYDLEVSSPGLDRHLRKPEHFKSAVGEVIELATSEPIAQWNVGVTGLDSRKKFSGDVRDFDGQYLKLSFENQELNVPFDKIRKAHVKVGDILKKNKKEGSNHGNR